LVTTEDDSEPAMAMGTTVASASFDSDMAAAVTYNPNQNAAVAFAAKALAETAAAASSLNSAKTVKVTATVAASQLTVRSADSPANRLLQSSLPSSGGGGGRFTGPLPVKAELVTNELEPSLPGRHK
jgi:hypothetical protein